MQIPFVGGSYTARSVNLDAQACINFYVEVDESGNGKSPSALIGCPGTRLLATLPGTGQVRGLWSSSVGDMIAVQGNYVYRVSSSYVATYIGGISTSSGPVSITDNGTDAVLVDGPNGYVINLATSAFNQITDPAFYGADKVDYLDNYFIFNRPGTQQFYISEIASTNFNALDFASAEGSPDNIVSFIVDHRQLIIFGSQSAEIFENTGAEDFPIQRAGNVFIEQGCIAPFSIVKIDNTVFWLGGNNRGSGVVWRLDGATPRRISTFAVEFAIQGYGDISDCVAYAYQQEGHSHIVFNFPSANATWCFDAATNYWHQRAYLNPSSGNLDRHRSNCHAFFNGEHIVGDWENGNLYALDLNYYSDNGDELPAIRAAMHLSDQSYRRIRFNALEIDFERGVGLVTGQGSNPICSMDYSDDGGHTWSNKKDASIGAIGEYKARARYGRLGMSRDRVYRITITDPVKRIIVGASSDAVGLST